MHTTRITKLQIAHKIPQIFHRSSEGGMIATEAEHCRDLIREYASRERHLGQAEVFHRIHRATGITVRRVEELFRGRVARVWADEWTAIVSWHRDWEESLLDRLRHEAAILEARTQARRNAARAEAA
jgi:hypothetical protein